MKLEKIYMAVIWGPAGLGLVTGRYFEKAKQRVFSRKFSFHMRVKSNPRKKLSASSIGYVEYLHVPLPNPKAKDSPLLIVEDNSIITAHSSNNSKKFSCAMGKKNDGSGEQLLQAKRKELPSTFEMPPAKRLSKGKKMGNSNSNDENKILVSSRNMRSKSNNNWSKDEDYLLLIITKFSNLGWRETSERLPGRSMEACQERLKKIKHMKVSWPVGTWTSEKDMAVKVLRSDSTLDNTWKTISGLLGEDEDSLRERYFRLKLG